MKTIIAISCLVAFTIFTLVPITHETEILSSDPSVLPLPTGNYPVGTRKFEVKDPNRSDILHPEIQRTLVGQFWYPAEIDNGTADTYIDSTVIRHMQDIDYYGIPDEVLARLQKINTNSSMNAPIVQGKIPVVLFIHGLGSPKGLHTILYEDLSSHGYGVIALDHPYGGITVTQERRLLSAEMDTISSFEEDGIRERMDEWSRDLKWVVSELSRPNSPLFMLHNGQLDLEHIAAGGHSLGGNIALGLAKYIPGIKGAFNMDGGSFQNLEETGLSIPGLFLRSYPLYSDADLKSRGRSRKDWDAMGKIIDSIFTNIYKNAASGVISVKIKGSAHFSYSDASYLIPSLVTHFGGTFLDKSTVKQLAHCHILSFLTSLRKQEALPVACPGSRDMIQEVYRGADRDQP